MLGREVRPREGPLELSGRVWQSCPGPLSTSTCNESTNERYEGGSYNFLICLFKICSHQN